MVFGDALERMKAGKRCTRTAWVFKDVIYIKYTSDMTPYLVVQAGKSEAIPYVATDIDLFADDWAVAADG
ncbi:Thoeris anti-defense Tad2 family protein [Mitsuokella jalaludinii]|uniref:Thoeris anti-defense Tad2 family protein n=1 Tax=Mitsuokella jalaludinii TaxID=187979 RepID=UPI0020D06E66|nr:MW1434 family type I TA system toxin [Mitsuokella jalaludinii]MCQ1533880.1 DUF2829 domain-containing protein [Mitsuokella jalaludinii]